MKRPYLLSTLWIWHSLFCLAAVLSCVVLLWPQVYLPDAYEAQIISYAGIVVLGSMLASLLLLAITTFIMLLKLHNRQALGQTLTWAGQWVATGAIFAALAYLADVPVPKIKMAAHSDQTPPEEEETALQPNDILTGPDALFILIPQERFAGTGTATVEQTPHLTQLENEHNELLELYLAKSPRWALYMDDDTFYTKPGHVVMSPPGTGSGIQGLVHVAFRHLVEGDPLPNGYTIVKPGSPMPARPEGSEQVADLAVDLGKNHYLLLAWRGTSHTETAHRALNSAIATVDALLQPLAESPSPDTVHRLLEGKRSMVAKEPYLLLCQPPSQYGAYQAEVYVNPGEAGTLILRIADRKSGATLRFLYCPALYSDNPDEVFRHDIPGSLSSRNSMIPYQNSTLVGHIPGLLPEKAPLFAIKQGEAHQLFDVVLELWFQPASGHKPRYKLLSRIYQVQACEAPTLPQLKPHEEPSADAPSTTKEGTP